MTHAKRYLLFWIVFLILSVFMAVSCQKDEPVCYECWSSTGIHEIFDNTTPETMQHTIDWWAENGIVLECKEIAR